jgi:hypothetical protein
MRFAFHASPDTFFYKKNSEKLTSKVLRRGFFGIANSALAITRCNVKKDLTKSTCGCQLDPPPHHWGECDAAYHIPQEKEKKACL